MDSQPLESGNVNKDFGLFTASDISWNKHIYICIYIDKITKLNGLIWF